MEALSQPASNALLTHVPATPPAPVRGVRIAYLLSQYPAISHTFFLHEVLGLRARGIDVATASINAPDRPLLDLPLAEAAEARKTFYVKRGGARTLLRALGLACTHPVGLFRGLRTILTLGGLTLRRRAFWIFYLAEALLVGAWMRNEKLNHLHVHFGGPVASVGMLVNAAWGIPFSLTIHGPEELLNHEAYHLREKLTAASFVLAISDFCRSQLCQLTPSSTWSKYTVVRLGVDPVILSPLHRRKKPDAATAHDLPVQIVCTGRLVAAKGHAVLLDALADLKLTGGNFHATLIGAGPERTTLEAKVRALDLQDQVTFTGALSHEATLERLRRADLFVLASFAEGIPVALMEAMSLGLPCVSTSIAGIPELIRTDIEGLLVAPGNAAALAAALSSLVHDDYLRHQLGSAARQRIITDYNLPLNQELLARTLLERTLPARTLPARTLPAGSVRP